MDNLHLPPDHATGDPAELTAALEDDAPRRHRGRRRTDTGKPTARRTVRLHVLPVRGAQPVPSRRGQRQRAEERRANLRLIRQLRKLALALGVDLDRLARVAVSAASMGPAKTSQRRAGQLRRRSLPHADRRDGAPPV